MEVSFSSDSFEWYLNSVSGIHSHFIINKKLFDTNIWKRDDLVLKYVQSAESENYMLNLGGIHIKEKCIDNNYQKLVPIREEINSKIKLAKKFTTYVNYHNQITIVSFLPINNIQNKVVAWIVSYENNPIIKSTLFNVSLIRVVSLFISLLIIYLLIKQINSNINLKNKTKEQGTLLSLFDEGDFVLFKWNNDDTWSTQHVSDNVENLLGYTKTEFLNKSITYSECIYVDDLNTFINEVEKAALTKEGYFEHKPYRIITKNSEMKWIRDRTILIKDINNNITHYVGYISDITEHINIENKVYIDGLTGVYNRNRFNEIFEEEFKSVKRYKNPLSIAILDIDKFKDFNDEYGHLIGDEVLITMAQIVNKNVRETDIFSRWGGEEFMILFKNTPANIAQEISQELKSKIEKNEHSTAGKITASFGVTEYRDGDTLNTLFKRCDDALYIAKEKGRNRVQVL